MSYPVRSKPQDPQVIRRPRCPICDSTNVECTTSRPASPRPGGGTVRYYRCRECKTIATQKPTTFKVLVL